MKNLEPQKSLAPSVMATPRRKMWSLGFRPEADNQTRPTRNGTWADSGTDAAFWRTQPEQGRQLGGVPREPPPKPAPPDLFKPGRGIPRARTLLEIQLLRRHLGHLTTLRQVLWRVPRCLVCLDHILERIHYCLGFSLPCDVMALAPTPNAETMGLDLDEVMSRFHRHIRSVAQAAMEPWLQTAMAADYCRILEVLWESGIWVSVDRELGPRGDSQT